MPGTSAGHDEGKPARANIADRAERGRALWHEDCGAPRACVRFFVGSLAAPRCGDIEALVHILSINAA
jgi:hypothetical protein